MKDFQKIQLHLIRIKKELRDRQRMDGGPGSGNWGHAGRPGERGGSAEGGGSHNRISEKGGGYTSYSKRAQQAKALAKPHKISKQELNLIAKDRNTIVIINGEQYYGGSKVIYCLKEFGQFEKVTLHEGDEVGIILPNSNTNFSLSKADKAAMSVRQESFDKAFHTSDKQEAYDKYVDQTAEVWGKLSEDEKLSVSDYTLRDYQKINSTLREGYGGDSSVNRSVDNLTKAIGMSEMKEDTVLYRVVDDYGFEGLLGLPEGYLKSDGPSIVGRVGTDDGFGSTSASKTEMDPNMMGGTVQLEILAPKGTKGLYVEPVSECGNGYGYSWNGKDRQTSISDENEVLLQRGTAYQVISYEKKGNAHFAKVAIISQDYEDSEYSRKRKER